MFLRAVGSLDLYKFLGMDLENFGFSFGFISTLPDLRLISYVFFFP